MPHIIKTLAMLICLAAPAAAQIVATPADPPLRPAICPGGLPGPANPIWNGEMRAWTPGPTRPLIKVSLAAYPNAVCNDGSPAAIYVRPAPATLPDGSANPLRRMYHIHFKGGGSCDGFADCLQRFCNIGSQATNKPGLMSSRGWHDAIQGTGLFAEHPRNRFSRANQVLIGYCTSDTYIGATPAGTAVSVKAGDDPARVSTIAFMGEHVVKAVLDELDSGTTASMPGNDREYQMPKLTDAKQVWITGDSGGANGARHHLDRIADRYSDAMVVGGLDAGGGVNMQDPRIDWSLMPSGPTDFKAFMDARVLQSRSFWNVQDSALDTSCKAAHPGSGFDEQACFNGFDLTRDHITTPLIQRVSLADNTTARGVGPMLPPPANQSLRQLTYDGLLELSAGNPDFSALGANCTRHVTFRNNRQVARMETLSGGLKLLEELDLWAFSCFRNGACPKMVTLAPPLAAGASTCP